MPFVRRSWRLQRTAWVVMGLSLLAAALGLFGDGVFSAGLAQDASGTLEIAYERVVRQDAEAKYVLRCRPGRGTGGTREVHVAMLGGLERDAALVSVEPRPLRTEAVTNGLRFVFLADADADSFAIVVRTEPESPGWLMTSFAHGAAPPISIRQLVLP